MRRMILAMVLVMIPAARWAGAEEPLGTTVSSTEQPPELSAEDLEVIKNLEMLENWDVLQNEEELNVDAKEEQTSTGEDNDQ